MTKTAVEVMTEWALAFAHHFLDAVHGEADIHDLLDWAYELYPANRHLDPVDVAKAQLAEQGLPTGD